MKPGDTLAEVRFFLALVLSGLVLCGVVPTASADVSETAPVANGPSEPEPRVSEEQAHTRLAMGGVGIFLSLGGIVAGAVLVRTPDIRSTGGDTNRAVKGAERKRRAGAFLLVVSPIALGASIFGVVRSKRNRREARGETKNKEPREPASWR